jgi:DNA-binding CsgD family transcriptional regulator
LTTHMPENPAIRTALLGRLSTYCGPWTPIALADFFVAVAMDLRLLTPDPQHLRAIAEGHVPLVVLTVAKALQANDQRVSSYTKMAELVLDALRTFGVDYSIASAEAVGLTPRQLQALTLIACGRTYEEIGTEMGLKPSSISTHLDRARKALGARNSTQAAVKAIKMGLIDITVAPVVLAAA